MEAVQSYTKMKPYRLTSAADDWLSKMAAVHCQTCDVISTLRIQLFFKGTIHHGLACIGPVEPAFYSAREDNIVEGVVAALDGKHDKPVDKEDVERPSSSMPDNALHNHHELNARNPTTPHSPVTPRSLTISSRPVARVRFYTLWLFWPWNDRVTQ